MHSNSLILIVLSLTLGALFPEALSLRHQNADTMIALGAYMQWPFGLYQFDAFVGNISASAKPLVQVDVADQSTLGGAFSTTLGSSYLLAVPINASGSWQTVIYIANAQTSTFQMAKVPIVVLSAVILNEESYDLVIIGGVPNADLSQIKLGIYTLNVATGKFQQTAPLPRQDETIVSMAYDIHEDIIYYISYSVNPFGINIIGVAAKTGVLYSTASLPSLIQYSAGMAYDFQTKSLISLMCPTPPSPASIYKILEDGKVQRLKTLQGVTCTSTNPSSFNPYTRKFVAFIDPDSPKMSFASVNVDSGEVGPKITINCGQRMNCFSRFGSVTMA